jgi:hypothetical protein
MIGRDDFDSRRSVTYRRSGPAAARLVPVVRIGHPADIDRR